MRINCLGQLLVAVLLLLLSYVNGSRSLQYTPATPVPQAILSTFDLNLCNENSFHLHMFTCEITNGIVTVNSYHKQ